MTDRNPHLRTEVARWGPSDAPFAVLGLHGRAQSPELIGELRRRTGDERLRWVAPAAADGSWYPFRFMDEPPPTDPWLHRSLDAVDAHLGALGRDGFPPERVVLLGFSQGACVLAHFALQHPRRFAGLVALTGGWIGPPGTDPGFAGDLGGTPVLLATRDGDDWVPLARAQDTERLLRERGAAVTALVEPPGEHAVSDTAALLLARFLVELPTTPPLPA